MNTYTISQKSKNKHLQFFHYEFIVNELIRFNALHSGHKRNIGKTQFIHYLSILSLRMPLSLLEIPILMNVLNFLLWLPLKKDLRSIRPLTILNFIRLMILSLSLKMKWNQIDFPLLMRLSIIFAFMKKIKLKIW